MISIRNLSHKIGDAEILNDISVDLPKGKITGLIGPNGAGKSTLLSLVARLEKLQCGAVTVGDLAVGACSNRELAKLLSILPQMPDQVPRLSVRELVSFGRYPYHQGRPTPEDDTQVDHALDVFGLTDLAQRSVDELSGGQRQRAQIAMTFAQDTEYMLLDEPLNNLDIAGARSLMALLRDLSDTHGKTIVIVLHDINYASRYADWLVALHNGKVAVEGPPAQTVTPDLLRDVFQTDAAIHQINGAPMVMV
ncbi:iron ABC transporter ATP-binding protein [Octadecabacter ascidiaceicola]|uniref:Putative siderophore transport system ATP-binding protein YusV n=1 Tax=Octadecabacter ascidiaceicola TaxID=1655543 RepID=A0A238JK28_9RHOB|nr:ATP-binding cassette domain-containing protein [Octadecabacter ascidiaceicola]SMX30845.1 putative siderophore transport system ATP-binding protein YusV [Octadecabacter ascidiaceicola]